MITNLTDLIADLNARKAIYLDKKAKGEPTDKEFVELIGESFGYSQHKIVEDLLTMEHINFDYICGKLIDDMKTSAEFGRNAACFKKLGMDKEAKELYPQSEFFIKARNFIGVLTQIEEVRSKPEFMEFLYYFSQTRFDLSPKPKLSLI